MKRNFRKELQSKEKVLVKHCGPLKTRGCSKKSIANKDYKSDRSKSVSTLQSKQDQTDIKKPV